MLGDVLKHWNAREISAMELYSDVFKLGKGYIQCVGKLKVSFKANPIEYYRHRGK